jgi:glyoxalase family protein
MSTITGLHHVTINSGDPQENLDFYVGVLGMRLVKKTVNQDAPETYHLFYADSAGTPGTDVTFFPWRGMPRGRPGTGETSQVMLAVPSGSLGWWADRLAAHGVTQVERARRFGEAVLAFEDPHGVSLALVETDDPREFTSWTESPVPASHQIRGLHAVRLTERSLEPTELFLTQGLGFALVGEEGEWRRYAVAGGGSGRVLELRVLAGGARAQTGVGSVHHVAFRVADEAAQLAAQEQVRAAGGRTTEVIDRYWFKSIYFREPGGALFEIATDGPGFTVDEDVASLGEQLILPPFLEPHRTEIERVLQPVSAPRVAGTT